MKNNKPETLSCNFIFYFEANGNAGNRGYLCTGNDFICSQGKKKYVLSYTSRG